MKTHGGQLAEYSTSCQHLTDEFGHIPVWHRVLCGGCRRLARVDSLIMRGVIALRSLPVPEQFECRLPPEQGDKHIKYTRDGSGASVLAVSVALGQVNRLLKRVALAVVMLTLALTAVVVYQDQKPTIRIIQQETNVPLDGFYIYADAVRRIRHGEDVDALDSSTAETPDSSYFEMVSLVPPVHLMRPMVVYREHPGVTPKLILANNAEALTRLREGFREFYREPSYSPQIDYDALYGGYLRLGRLLVLEAQHHFLEGRYEAGAKSALDAIRFGVTIQAGAGSAGRLVGLRCETIGRQILWRELDNLPASVARQSVRTLEELNVYRTPTAQTYAKNAEMAVAMFLTHGRTSAWRWAGVSRLRRTPQSDGPSALLRFLMSLPHSRQEVLETINNRSTEEQEWATTSYPRHAPRPTGPSWRDPLLIAGLWWPPASLVQFANDFNVADTGLLTVALALRAYRLEQGAYPTDLTALVSKGYLTVIPQDPFTIIRRSETRPVRYRLMAGLPVVYSVGPDGLDNRGMTIMSRPELGESVVFTTALGDIVGGVNTDWSSL